MKKQMVKKHLGILLAGFLHALKCAGAIALLAAAVFLFYCVTIESGYFAVCKFIAALMAVALSLLLFYDCGNDLLGGKFSK